MTLNLVQCGEHRDRNSITVIVPDSRLSESEARHFAGESPNYFDTYVYSGDLPKVDKVSEFAELFLDALKENNIKKLTLMGVGSGGSVAQAVAIAAIKETRRLVLWNATTRIAPTVLDRAVDKLEQFLPLGLPLRPLSKAFDSRSTLHRIHCPTLVLLSKSDHQGFISEQSRFIARKIPNAWLHEIDSRPSTVDAGVASLLHEFMQVPTKRPQKNL